MSRSPAIAEALAIIGAAAMTVTMLLMGFGLTSERFAGSVLWLAILPIGGAIYVQRRLTPTQRRRFSRLRDLLAGTVVAAAVVACIALGRDYLWVGLVVAMYAFLRWRRR
jgi:hypothetical protein